MENFGDTSFSYAGKKYAFIATVMPYDCEETILLDNNDVEEFEYTNEFNGLTLYGSITYTDKYGKLDKLLDKLLSYCSIQFFEKEWKEDADFKFEKKSNTEDLDHLFIIENISILERNNNSVLYQLFLRSKMLMNCMLNIDYSNYDREPEEVTDILAACFNMTNLLLDRESDSETTTGIHSKVSLNYATSGNDTLQSAVHYLLSRTFFYDDNRDSSILMVYYDELKKKYRLFDIADDNSIKTYTPIALTFFSGNTEELFHQDQADFSAVIKLPATAVIEKSFAKQISYYCLDNNILSSKTIDLESLLQYFNAKSNTNTNSEKFYSTESSEYPNQYHRATYWNDAQQLNSYDDMFELLTKNNAMVINTAGEIMRKPGTFVSTSVDRNMNFVQGEDKWSLNHVKNAYAVFDNLWIVSKVHHFVNLQEKSYRLNLVLTHNFINKTHRTTLIAEK